MHTFNPMKISHFLLLFLCFSSCGRMKPSTENELNAYLPPSFQENSLPNFPIEQAPLPSTLKGVWDISDVDITRIDKNRKLIAFTFDDTPAKCLESIIAVFASFNERNPTCPASATLFINGCRGDPTVVPLLHTAKLLGFELGNHTQHHYDLTTLTNAELLSEINETDTFLQTIDGKERHLLRAPFGKLNEAVRTQAFTPIIDWTIDTLDWTGVSAESICEKVITHAFSGAIVLMHDGYKGTVDALKLLLPKLAEDGYQVVGVSQLAKVHNCTLKNGSVYIQARKKRE